MKPIDLRQLLKKIHALLNIEWTYEAESARPCRDSDDRCPRSALLAGNDIDELISLGEIGHVRRIHEKLAEIESNSPAYAATSSRRCARS